MRAIVQKVIKASVTVENHVIGKIDKGLLIFLAVHEEDGKDDLDYILKKVSKLRIFEDEDNKMNLSIEDVGGEFLVVSQFTLYGDVRKGNRPSFTQSAKHEKADDYYQAFIKGLKEKTGLKVETGKFAADMKVELINDGPVTIQLDSTKIY
ncbi:D-aminoacyl-tRNA deacylase [Lagierella sp.]|uniref:D-aminoacyl-tRNA deacylase n=1 Tax=Lagierella sp. TaxID=2849657 RepID=UPI00262DEA63|nr:D-aminoacyl-tRNA deacylase [Lagierella sp.]